MFRYEENAAFYDRIDAGNKLAEKLARFCGSGAVVFGVPRGGVPVGIEVAKAIGAAFDIVITRKIAMPHNPEAGYGAVTEDGAVVLNRPLAALLKLTGEEIKAHVGKTRAEIIRRSGALRGKLNPCHVGGKTAIIVDDGLATGYTVLAAIESLRKRNPSRIVVGTPVSSSSAYELVGAAADEIESVVVSHAYSFAVASFYSVWSDMTDEEVFQSINEWLAGQLQMNGYHAPAAAQ